VAGCYPGCYVRITVSGESLPTLRCRVMRTFTPAAHACARTAGTRSAIIVRDSLRTVRGLV